MLDANTRFQRCLNFVCGPSIEGGFSNDPRDPGGATNHGITIGTLSHWRGRTCTVADVQQLQLAEAMAIYRAWYWNVVSGDNLPAGLDLIVFDAAVNQGPGTAAMFLQEAVEAVADGHIGPNTLAAIRVCDPVQAITAVAHHRDQAYHAAAQFPTYGNGWLTRLGRVTDQSLAWAREN